MRKCLSIILTLMLMLNVVTPTFAGESSTAATMRLEKTEGTVSIKNQNGTALTVRNNSKLYNGYTIGTELSSYAYIGLDDKKAVKIDESSSISVKKSGKKLELLVNNGQIFFNVKEPLASDETMEIRTSTMVTGIRGTSGVIRNIDSNITEFYLLDGTVSIAYIDDKTSETSSIKIVAGEAATITNSYSNDGTAIASLDVKELTADDISGFVAVEIAKDTELQKKIGGQTKLDVKTIVNTANDKLQKDQSKNKNESNVVEKKLLDRDKTENKSVNNSENKSGDKSGDNSSGGSDSDTESKPKYAVKFKLDDGTRLENQYIRRGKTVTRPTNPIKEGAIFDGWYNDSDFNELFDFDKSIKYKRTLYGRWIYDDIILSNSDNTLNMKSFTDALENNKNITIDIGDDERFVFNLKSENLEIPKNKTLTIASGTFKTVSMSTASVINYGTMVINGNFVNEVAFENYGDIKTTAEKGEPLITNDSTFIMQGGSIDGGERTAIKSKYELIINGGIISSSAAKTVYVLPGKAIWKNAMIVNGGIIENTMSDAPQEIEAAAVLINRVHVEMIGGIIRSKYVGIRNEESSGFVLLGGSVQGDDFGIITSGKFEMQGGEVKGDVGIQNNYELIVKGGIVEGVSKGINSDEEISIITISDNAKITSENVGIYFKEVKYGETKLIIKDDAIIECTGTNEDCFALETDGGVIYGITFGGGTIRAKDKSCVTNISNGVEIIDKDDWYILVINND